MIIRAMGMLGYSSFAATRTAKDIFEDTKHIRGGGMLFVKEMVWAWKRGFTGSRVHTYGINESNYRNHIPDFDYYKLHPINGKYGRWIDDKLTMKYMLAPFNEYLPKYYFQIEDDAILKLMDCPDDIEPNIDGIICLLKRDGNLALKLLSGSLGRGFYRLTCKNMTFYVNTKKVDTDELRELIGNLEGYLVTEYIIAHQEIRKIYDVTPNTLRVQLIRKNGEKSRITESHIKIGSRVSGLLETISAGTIFAKVDLATGALLNSQRIINGKLECITQHPDTNERLNILLPYWVEIKTLLHRISDYMPQLSYLGFDIIITDRGLKIIEINSLSSIIFSSYFYPHFRNKHCIEFFKNKFKERPDRFKRILKILGE